MTLAQHHDPRKQPRLPPSVAGRDEAHGRPSPTRHLSATQFARLLACIDDAGGVATMDEISHALPRVRRPISAVFDLRDAGILDADLESAFDGDMHVWRVDG